MHDLPAFALSDMIQCGTALRGAATDATNMEEAADRMVRYLYENLVAAASGIPACALVRCYKTHPYGDLPPDLRAFAAGLLGDHAVAADVPCLTLLATAGALPAWNARSQSAGHKCIPLPSQHVIAQMPMIAQLIRQFGLDLNMLWEPDPTLLLDVTQRAYNVFHVEEAQGSPWVPAQAEFVLPYGICSVLGFGGVVPPGELFAIILFSTVPLSHETADLFKTVALSAKAAVLPFTDGRTFPS